jgi:hypothetical protein
VSTKFRTFALVVTGTFGFLLSSCHTPNVVLVDLAVPQKSAKALVVMPIPIPTMFKENSGWNAPLTFGKSDVEVLRESIIHSIARSGGFPKVKALDDRAQIPNDAIMLTILSPQASVTYRVTGSPGGRFGNVVVERVGPGTTLVTARLLGEFKLEGANGTLLKSRKFDVVGLGGEESPEKKMTISGTKEELIKAVLREVEALLKEVP